MDPNMNISWGGRSLGLGLVAGIAVMLKSPTAYIAAFVGGIGREIGDLMAELSKVEPSTGVLVGIVVFMVIGLLGILSANKARKMS